MEKECYKEERRNAFHIMSAYRITEVGFDKTEAIFFRTTIEMASEYDISEWSWVGDRDADVIFVNSDKKRITSEFDNHKPKRNSIRPILIGCSTSDEKCDSFPYTLKKPITYSMIITLLRKLEPELASAVQTSPPLKEQHNQTSREQHTSRSLLKKMFSKIGSQSDTDELSTSPPTEDNQDHRDQQIDIEDSDYDVYALLMDADFDDFESEDRPTPDTNTQQTTSDQTKTPSKTHRAKTNNKMYRPTLGYLEERRFIGLIKKHVLSKFKITG